MPKGQITEEELASGLRGMAGLSPLARTRRDSPFRDSRSEPKAIDIRPTQLIETPIVQSEEISIAPSAPPYTTVKQSKPAKKVASVESRAGNEKGRPA